MKKYLFFAAAAMVFAACAEKGFDSHKPAEKGEMEQSYLAVSLMSDDMTTRAAGDVYEEGDPSERFVNTFHFFLFDEKGDPFIIDGDTNYKPFEIKENENDFGTNNPGNEEGDGNEEGEGDIPEGDEWPNVSDIKDKVLVFENYKGEYPAKIVAVLNWTPSNASPLTLDELAEEISDLRNGSGAFVMSNSVYALDGAKKEAIKATALTPENIAKNEEDALNNPVHVFVERIAAKVTVSAAQPKFDTGKEIAGKKIYATVDGWDLYNDYDQSYLLKHIDENWTSAELGFNWNDASWFRSYWAKSLNTPFVDAENQISYDGMPYLLDESAYCGENTGNADCTMVVVKASLVDENGNAVEVATWHGHSYLGESSLLQVIANSLASRLYYFDGTKYNSIEPGHLMVKEASEPNPDSSADVKAYHVFFQLSAAGEGMTWYTYSTADGFKAADKNAVNVILGGVEPALLYKNGQTYFATEIKHYETVLGEKKYGVVRNHVYKVNINSISGFGTPVYNGNTKFDPEQPSDVTTFVSAEIRVLSWKVVEFDYDLK